MRIMVRKPFDSLDPTNRKWARSQEFFHWFPLWKRTRKPKQKFWDWWIEFVGWEPKEPKWK